jgi:ATP-dependent Clp protease ATP-binding subunit ClpB
MLDEISGSKDPRSAESDSLEHAPVWLRDIHRFLPVVPQFLLTGNINDQYLVEEKALVEGKKVDRSMFMADALWFMLEANDFDALLLFDRFDCFEVYAPTPAAMEAVWRAAKPSVKSWQQYQEEYNIPEKDGKAREHGAEESQSGREHGHLSEEEEINRQFWEEGKFKQTLQELPDTLRNIVTCETARVAVLIRQASRLLLNSQQLSQDEGELFGAMWKLANGLDPLKSKSGRDVFTPIFWAAENANLLPDWFVVGNERVRQQSIPKPDLSMRLRYANYSYDRFEGHESVSEDRRNELLKIFAKSTEGMTLTAMENIATMAGDLKKDFTKLSEAVTAFKLGVTEESQWTSPAFKESIATAREIFGARVVGQEPAVEKTIDILIRSAMGLSGVHTSDETSPKPQGVLFLAGPTGTGKTQLAKEITKLLFGSDDAYIRFDMSEFSQEHSESRLIGAPPGYVGYDAGGELTRAIRERPASVVLFDEIEKAHGRILDKFLQILDDGRLTDNRGNTVYFSEALIIFTSNLGIYDEKNLGHGLVERTQIFSFEEIDEGKITYDDIEKRVREEIGKYFKFKLNRPEILNRIGDNIVVFNFISKSVAEKIFDGMLTLGMKNASKKHRITLEITDKAKENLQAFITTASARENGGRGIANQIEACFINPLSRALFWTEFKEGSTISVVDCRKGESNAYVVEVVVA